MSYTQNDEEEVILKYFGSDVGHLTDIGANDGVTFSNSRELILRGWSADLIEPSPLALKRLEKLYADHPKVSIYPYAITDKPGPIILHESDSHHGDNVALLSTVDPNEIKRWKGTQQFTPVEVQGKTWRNLSIRPGRFVSIDAEGLDYMILRQIPLTRVDLVCVEYNADMKELMKMTAVCKAYGLKLIHKNFENAIFAR